jgi:hypothetical protein
VRRTARQLFKELEGPVDEHFKQSVAGLSGQLGERAAWKTTSDPKAAAEARRAALQAYDLARARRWKTALQAVGAAMAAAGIAGLTIFIAISPDKLSPNVTASVARAPSIGRVAAATPPAALPPIASAPSTSAAPAIVPMVSQVVPATASEPAPVKPEPAKPVPIKPAPVEAASVEPAPVPAAEPAPLRRDEVAEVQTRLHSFGFNPGPPDGAVGPMTQAAVMRYLQDRGQPQTATIDPELLEQLRQDPAPPVAAPQVAQRTARPVRASSAARQSDPFEPMRVAAQNVERWFQSLGR